MKTFPTSLFSRTFRVTGYLCRTAVVFGTLKDGSLQIIKQERLPKWRQRFVTNG